METQTEVLAGQAEQGFGQHPDAEIFRCLPGLGMILGARVLAEFGDDPDRYVDAKVARTTPACHPSPRPRAPNGLCWPATPATADSPTPCSCRRFARLPAPQAPARSTTGNEPAATPTTEPSAPSETGSSASSTAAYEHHTLYDETPRLAHRTRQLSPAA